MKYIDEYRSPELVKGLLAGIQKRAEKIGNQVTIMEVCGSHTYAIGHFGIRGMLPKNIKLISGPGCPVCVTSIHDVDVALFLAKQKNLIFATFGDMLKVPGTGGESLQKIRASGADVRIVASALDCIDLAEKNKDKEIMFMGIGFETTSPTIASVVKTCAKKGISNFSVFSVHKIVPPAIDALINDPALSIDGFLCPGHVSVILGSNAYIPIVQKNRAAVITGFEPVDIIEGIFMILGQMLKKEKSVEIQYSRGVKTEGNVRALAVMNEVFSTTDADWRGLGVIPGSGLKFRTEYAAFDALRKIDVPEIKSQENKGCACGDILKGIKYPYECVLFKKACTPTHPIGPCMVSTEGSCAAYYKYS